MSTEEQKPAVVAESVEQTAVQKDQQTAEQTAEQKEEKPQEQVAESVAETVSEPSEEKPKLSKEDYLKLQRETDARSVFVGNVDYSSTNEELFEFFKPVGDINRVTILRDRFSGHPKGFAYVEFASADSLPKACELSGSEFKGRQLDITAKRTNIPGYSYKNYRNYYNNNSYRGGPHRGGSFRGRGGSYRGSRGGPSRGRGGYRQQQRRYEYHNESQHPHQAPAVASEQPAAVVPESTPVPAPAPAAEK